MIVAKEQASSLKSPWTWVVVAALAVALTVVLLDILVWTPGFAAVDEEWALEKIQAFRDRGVLDIAFANGSLTFLLQLAAGWVTGFSVPCLQALGAVLMVAQVCLLRAIAKDWWGREAACFACLAFLVSATSWLWARSLLAFQVLPFWLLLGLWLLHKARGWVGTMALGVASGLVLFDYEGWPVAMAVLALAARFEPRRGSGRRLGELLAGMALGGGVVALVSADQLPSYFSFRHAQSAPSGLGFLSFLGTHLRQYWLGGETIPFMGVTGSPVFAIWAIPLLAIGVIASGGNFAWLAVGGVLGLLPLGLRSAALEPNRTAAAWPLFCLLAGCGGAAVWRKLAERRNGKALAVGVLSALVLVGGALEFRAFRASQAAADPVYYAKGRRVMALGRSLRGSGIRHVAVELGGRPQGWLRLAMGLEGQPGRFVPEAAVVPWQYAGIALDAKAGRLEALPTADGQPPVFVLWPSTAQAARLQGVESGLWRQWSRGRNLLRRDEVRWILDAARRADIDKADPWVRTALWERAIDTALDLGDFDAALVGEALRGPLVSAGALVEVAYRAEGLPPRLLFDLSTRAVAIDPRYRALWKKRWELMDRLGMSEARAREQARVSAMGANATWWGLWM